MKFHKVPLTVNLLLLLCLFIGFLSTFTKVFFLCFFPPHSLTHMHTHTHTNVNTPVFPVSGSASLVLVTEGAWCVQYALFLRAPTCATFVDSIRVIIRTRAHDVNAWRFDLWYFITEAHLRTDVLLSFYEVSVKQHWCWKKTRKPKNIPGSRQTRLCFHSSSRQTQHHTLRHQMSLCMLACVCVIHIRHCVSAPPLINVWQSGDTICASHKCIPSCLYLFLANM